MNLNQLSRYLYTSARATRDARAVQSGRVPERIVNRMLGRLVAGLLRGLWR